MKHVCACVCVSAGISVCVCMYVSVSLYVRLTHMAVPPPRPSKLQLSKGICGILRGVLGTVPLADNRRPKIVACGNGAMHLTHTSALAQCSIAEPRDSKTDINREYVEIQVSVCVTPNSRR